MKIKRLISVAHHRNGVSGTPFDAVIFRDAGPERSVKLGIVFDEPSFCAVLDIAKLADFDIEFGSNTWRGDEYEPALRRAIAERQIPIESGISGTGQDTGKPVVVVTVQGGLVSDVNATSPATIFVEDWDCPEEPLVMDFEAESLTPEQEKRVRERMAENDVLSKRNREEG